MDVTTESTQQAEYAFASQTRKAERAAVRRRAALKKKRAVAERLLRRKTEIEQEELRIAAEEEAVATMLSRALAPFSARVGARTATAALTTASTTQDSGAPRYGDGEFILFTVTFCESF